MGMISQLQQAGFSLGAFDMVIGGNIPVGAGLSSSAALSVAVGTAISHLFNLPIDKKSLARYSQKSEQLFAGLQCGIMDPYASIFGEKGHALFLDCRSNNHQSIPLALTDHQLLLVNTKVKHSLADTAYNDRRAACEDSVRILKEDYVGIKTLRDIEFSDLDRVKKLLPAALWPKAKHIITEDQRVLDAKVAIESGNIEALGQLMYLSHLSLSKDYEVSCEELDFLVNATKTMDGVLGARMMGGGFGGCTLNLVETSHLPDFESKIRESYVSRFQLSPEFIPVELSVGAKRIS